MTNKYYFSLKIVVLQDTAKIGATTAFEMRKSTKTKTNDDLR